MAKELDREAIRNRLGNIAQLQELLFGDYIERYDRQFKKLESDLSQLQANFTEHLAQLQANFDRELNSLAVTFDKKLESLTLTNQIENSKLQQELQAKTKINEENVTFLQNSFKLQTKFLKDELLQTREALEVDQKLLKQQLLNKIEQGLSELNSSKISRRDLGDILFELCLKLKGTELLTDFKSTEKDFPSDSLLLEESSKE
jgi:hypothetical protein